MSVTTYAPTSFYSTTSQTSWYLEQADIVQIPNLLSDVQITVQKKYEHRPDLLSYDLYGTAKLWWVFALKNPNIIRDPIFGMLAGIQIVVTKKEELFELING